MRPLCRSFTPVSRRNVAIPTNCAPSKALQIRFRRIAKTLRDGFHRSCAMLFHRFAESKGSRSSASITGCPVPPPQQCLEFRQLIRPPRPPADPERLAHLHQLPCQRRCTKRHHHIPELFGCVGELDARSARVFPGLLTVEPTI